MGKIAIVTDSNSGITQEEAKELGIRVVPMPFYINGELYYEDITLTQDEFYEKLETGADISTSQPSPGDVMELWEELLEEYDEVIHIPMSSGLSSSCENAIMLAREFEGKVYVVDNQRISVTLRQSVEDAMMMRDKGMSGEEIVDALMREKLESSIYITVDTLKYLKKGGRITPAAAAIGTVLNLKPVLQIQGEKLDAFAKVRGWRLQKRQCWMQLTRIFIPVSQEKRFIWKLHIHAQKKRKTNGSRSYRRDFRIMRFVQTNYL